MQQPMELEGAEVELQEVCLSHPVNYFMLMLGGKDHGVLQALMVQDGMEEGQEDIPLFMEEEEEEDQISGQEGMHCQIG